MERKDTETAQTQSQVYGFQIWLGAAFTCQLQLAPTAVSNFALRIRTTELIGADRDGDRRQAKTGWACFLFDLRSLGTTTRELSGKTHTVCRAGSRRADPSPPGTLVQLVAVLVLCSRMCSSSSITQPQAVAPFLDGFYVSAGCLTATNDASLLIAGWRCWSVPYLCCCLFCRPCFGYRASPA